MKFNPKKTVKLILLVFLLFFLVLIFYFFVGSPEPARDIKWGVNFSQKHVQNLGLDWKKTYLALIDDLGVKEIKIASHWDILEPEDGKYNFEDLDWQIDQAEKRKIRVILVVGMKTPRWPECHIPHWAKDLDISRQQEKVFELVRKIIVRYKNKSSIWAWQVENEPFFSFGECPPKDKNFLKKEIEIVKFLDQRPIIISESGEMSLWLKAGKMADIVGVTMYRKVFSKEVKMYFSLPYPPVFYWRKARLIGKLFNKKVICVELQAEPWGPKLLYDSSIEEQSKTMNLEQFKKNIEFARKTGLDVFYLWGGEWWFWLKEKHNQSEIWEEAKRLFNF